MRAMSRGATDRGPGRGGESPHNPEKRHSWARHWPIVARFLAPAAAALALVSVLTPAAELDSDIALVAPRSVARGDRVPLRALIYVGLDAVEGPRLVHARTDVSLRGADGSDLAVGTRLRAGRGPSLEGSLDLAGLPAGKYTLAAHAQLPGGHVRVERPLEITEGQPREQAEAVPRALRPTQQLALGPIAKLHDAIAPDPLDLRVSGGACVPELPCELLVHVGEPEAALVALSSPSVTVERIDPRSITSGVVTLQVRTHGPEAELELTAQRDFESFERVPVAKRSVRLPIALGADAMTTESVLGPDFRFRLAGEAPHAIADVFVSGNWRYTRTDRSFADIPWRPRGELIRVQLHRDPFGSGGAAVRTFYRRLPSDRSSDVLSAIARKVLDSGVPTPPRLGIQRLAGMLDGQPLPQIEASELDRRARYLFALLDTDVYALPEATHGYPLAQARAAAHRADVRRLALVVLALAAVSLALLLVQRGLRGSVEAERVLRASGMSSETRSRARLSRTLRIAGAAVSVLLAFLAIALYLIARGQGQ
jgi:hypothetical protein